MPAESAASDDPVGPPDTSIVGGAPEGSSTLRRGISLELDYEGAVRSVACSIDGGAFNRSCTFTKLEPGEHTVAARATGRDGQVDPTPATRTYTVLPYPGRQHEFDARSAGRAPVGAEVLRSVDIDADGHIDLLALDGDGLLSGLPGRGDGTFERPRTLATGILGFTVGDLDSSAGDDVVISRVDTDGTGSFQALVSSADGNFGLQPAGASSPALYPARSEEMGIGDFNADGFGDLASTTDYGLETRIGDAADGFGTPTGTTVELFDFDDEGPPVPNVLSVATLDSEPGDDVYLGAYQTFSGIGPVFALSSDGDGSFAEIPAYGTSVLAAAHLVSGDLDGDAVDDLVIPSAGGGGASGSIRTWIPDPAGKWSYDNIFSMPESAMRPAIADFDQDGFADIAIDGGPRPLVRFGVGEGEFEPRASDPTDPDPAYNGELVADDFDGDGTVDIAVGGPGGFETFLNREPAARVANVAIPRGVRALRRSGARVRFSCVGACKVVTTLRVPRSVARRSELRSRIVGTARGATRGGSLDVVTRLGERAYGELRANGVERLRVTVKAAASSGDRVRRFTLRP